MINTGNNGSNKLDRASARASAQRAIDRERKAKERKNRTKEKIDLDNAKSRARMSTARNQLTGEQKAIMRQKARERMRKRNQSLSEAEREKKRALDRERKAEKSRVLKGEKQNKVLDDMLGVVLCFEEGRSVDQGPLLGFDDISVASVSSEIGAKLLEMDMVTY